MITIDVTPLGKGQGFLIKDPNTGKSEVRKKKATAEAAIRRIIAGWTDAGKSVTLRQFNKDGTLARSASKVYSVRGGKAVMKPYKGEAGKSKPAPRKSSGRKSSGRKSSDRKSGARRGRKLTGYNVFVRECRKRGLSLAAAAKQWSAMSVAEQRKYDARAKSASAKKSSTRKSAAPATSHKSSGRKSSRKSPRKLGKRALSAFALFMRHVKQPAKIAARKWRALSAAEKNKWKAKAAGRTSTAGRRAPGSRKSRKAHKSTSHTTRRAAARKGASRKAATRKAATRKSGTRKTRASRRGKNTGYSLFVKYVVQRGKANSVPAAARLWNKLSAKSKAAWNERAKGVGKSKASGYLKAYKSRRKPGRRTTSRQITVVRRSRKGVRKATSGRKAGVKRTAAARKGARKATTVRSLLPSPAQAAAAARKHTRKSSSKRRTTKGSKRRTARSSKRRGTASRRATRHVAARKHSRRTRRHAAARKSHKRSSRKATRRTHRRAR